MFDGAFTCMHPFLQEHYMVTTACFTDEIPTVLKQHYQGSGKPLLFLLHGLNTDSNNFSKPAEFQVLNSYHFFYGCESFLTMLSNSSCSAADFQQTTIVLRYAI